MKKTVLYFISAASIFHFSFLWPSPQVRQIHALIEASDLNEFKKVYKENLFDHAERRVLREYAAEVVKDRKVIKMTKWDRLKVISGLCLQIFWIPVPGFINELLYAQADKPGALGEKVRTALQKRRDTGLNMAVSTALIGLGLVAAAQGWKCKSARALLSQAEQIEDILAGSQPIKKV